MISKKLVAVALSAIVVTATGCSVMRGQETTGAYVDDAAITTRIKSAYAADKAVAATAISVETLNGTVMLSGFAKSAAEKTTAEALARKVDGVKSVKNELAIAP